MVNRKDKRPSRRSRSSVDGSSSRRKPPGAGGRRARGKRPVLRFVVLFALFIGAFQLACVTPFMKDTVFPSYLRVNARLSAAVIGVFEESLTVMGKRISSPRGALVIERGCDAIEPSALFLAGVLAFPAAFAMKLPGMLIGTLCLMVLNLVRIISLFYVQIYYPRAFHIMHVDVWQSLFVFLAIAAWVWWALWATKPRSVSGDAPSSATA